MRSRTDILLSLTEFQSWQTQNENSPPLTAIDFVGFLATRGLFFGFAELFCPSVVAYKGGVFLADGFSEENVEAWLGKGIGLRETQRVINHLHISTLIQNQEVGEIDAIEIADHLAFIWRLTLAQYSVVVEIIGEGFEDLAVTFFKDDRD
jgi:hypothetical protein